MYIVNHEKQVGFSYGQKRSKTHKPGSKKTKKGDFFMKSKYIIVAWEKVVGIVHYSDTNMEINIGFQVFWDVKPIKTIKKT